MAKSTATGETEATTLIFPKKSAWEELIDAKATAKKRAQSANGAFSKVMARLVEEEHMDRRAARILVSLAMIEDDEDLHVTFHHLMDGIQKLKLDERAMAAPDFFTNAVSPQGATGSAKNAKAGGAKGGKGGKGGKNAPDMTNVTSIGDAARRVAEEAGGAQAGA